MVGIDGEIVIERPVEVVFDFVADARNEPRYNPGMLSAEKLSPGPVGLGTRFRDEVRSIRGPAAIDIVVTGYERPRWLAQSIRMSPMDIQGTLAFDQVPGGTRMRWAWKVKPRGVLRLAGPLVGRVGARQERRIWTGLKRFLEAREAPLPTGVAGPNA